MMKTLLILRHAKSSWNEGHLPDYERPLNKRGERNAPEMGHLLVEKDLLPEYILSSSAKRAQQTVYLVAKACGYAGKIAFERALYASGPKIYLDTLRDVDDGHQRVM